MSESNPANAAPPQPVIIKKVKGGHGGHHGGAWKVAYADFVTAMMALFIVLWLMNTSKAVQDAVSGYFKDPKGFAKQTGTGQAGTGQGITFSPADVGQLKGKLEAAIKQLPEFQKIKEHVQISVTGEGVRIELLESEKGMFFDSGSPRPSDHARHLLAMLGPEIGKMPVNVIVEGHTDSKPYSGTSVYSNWELSTERANAARQVLIATGVGGQQVRQVRGFADQQLRKPEQPTDASNRRVSIIVQFQNPTGSAPPEIPKITQGSLPVAAQAASGHSSKGH